METFLLACQDVARDIVTALEIGLGLPVGAFTRCMETRVDELRLNYYSPLPRSTLVPSVHGMKLDVIEACSEPLAQREFHLDSSGRALAIETLWHDICGKGRFDLEERYINGESAFFAYTPDAEQRLRRDVLARGSALPRDPQVGMARAGGRISHQVAGAVRRRAAGVIRCGCERRPLQMEPCGQRGVEPSNVCADSEGLLRLGSEGP